jgi:hypothetical protein
VHGLVAERKLINDPKHILCSCWCLRHKIQRLLLRIQRILERCIKDLDLEGTEENWGSYYSLTGWTEILLQYWKHLKRSCPTKGGEWIVTRRVFEGNQLVCLGSTSNS